MALCTYFDIRDAERAVRNGMSARLRGRPVRTNFGYKPPAHCKRNLKEIASTILCQSSKSPSEISLEQIKTAMAVFGEIRAAEQRDAGSFVVKYYDLRDAQRCSETGMVTLKGEKVKLELLEQEDLGDEAVEPPPRQYRTESGPTMPYLGYYPVYPGYYPPYAAYSPYMMPQYMMQMQPQPAPPPQSVSEPLPPVESAQQQPATDYMPPKKLSLLSLPE
jgi:hypothetical protein